MLLLVLARIAAAGPLLLAIASCRVQLVAVMLHLAGVAGSACPQPFAGTTTVLPGCLDLLGFCRVRRVQLVAVRHLAWVAGSALLQPLVAGTTVLPGCWDLLLGEVAGVRLLAVWLPESRSLLGLPSSSSGTGSREADAGLRSKATLFGCQGFVKLRSLL